MKVLNITLIILAVCLIFGSGDITFAEGEYVDECLERPELCDDSLTPGVESQKQSELLQEKKTESLFLEVVRLIFALLLVIGLIYFFLYFLRKKNKFGNRIESLENLGGITVGQNKSVQLIRLGDRLFLIGVGENITLLDEITDEDIIQKIMNENLQQMQDVSAGKLLGNLISKNNGKKDSFHQLFTEELKQLKQNRKSIIDKSKEDRNE